MATKTLLFLFTHSPYAGSHAREALEALLAAAAFEQDPAVVFMHEGVWQLLPQASSPHYKEHSKMLKALPMYGIGRLYVDSISLSARRISESSLIVAAECVGSAQIAQLIASADHVLSF